MNPIFLTDCYKLDHRRQYPAGTTAVYSNWTPRSSRIPGYDKVVFFGLRYLLECYLQWHMRQHFFRPDEKAIVSEYGEFLQSCFGPNDIGTDHIRDLHRLGYLPLRICALPEGTRCPIGVPMLTVENTRPEFFWLTNYIETMLSAVLWLPCTSATTAFYLRAMLDYFARSTGGDLAFVPWQGHDFSMRGMAGIEAGQLSGAGHLLSFSGTDTVSAIKFIEQWYDGGCVAGSVPATEHSVMSAGGCSSGDERNTFLRLLSLYPKGIVSVVSDTWDFWHVLKTILPSLKPNIMARDGKLVIRPDSGDPVNVVCGDATAAPGSPERAGAMELLWDTFGGTVNAGGYRALDSHIGLIYGDAITHERANAICEGLRRKRFASTNIVFGVGSYTYQYQTRDTFGFAQKATWARVNGVGCDLFKSPKGDASKKSLRGRLAVVRGPNGIETIQQASSEQERDSLLQPVFVDGALCGTAFDSFSVIRARLDAER